MQLAADSVAAAAEGFTAAVAVDSTAAVVDMAADTGKGLRTTQYATQDKSGCPSGQPFFFAARQDVPAGRGEVAAAGSLKGAGR
jgi:hypothetical protein